jgi:radical SAM superfamily enzyme YgiQ (UPF0313 family)
MKIVLTHSYFLEEDEQEKSIMKPYPPLGLLYLSAYLKQNKIPVELFDTTFSSYSNLISYLDSQKPDVLGIYCNMMTKFNVLKLVVYCKKNKIISILGGPDAATQAEEFLNYGANIIVVGEGEKTLKTIIENLENKKSTELNDIPNIIYKNNSGTIIRNERIMERVHLDDYPYPDRQATDINRYLDTWEKHHRMRPISLITARGCAFKCKWCSHSVYGHTHRRRTPQNVVDEIKEIVKNYNPTHLWYADDVFTVNKRWLEKFNNLMKNSNLLLPFECITRADKFDAETAKILKELGCYRVWIGAESGSQKILDSMSRGVTIQQVENSVNLCKELGIQVGMFFMFGYPGETIEDINESIEFVSTLQPDQYFTSVAYPLRGTALFDETKEELIIDKKWIDLIQNEIEIKNRFTKPLYDFVAKKMASEYRKKNLSVSPKWIYHVVRSMYCDYKINQLSNSYT